jgi:hypothetical protein
LVDDTQWVQNNVQLIEKLFREQFVDEKIQVFFPVDPGLNPWLISV